MPPEGALDLLAAPPTSARPVQRQAAEEQLQDNPAKPAVLWQPGTRKGLNRQLRQGSRPRQPSMRDHLHPQGRILSCSTSHEHFGPPAGCEALGISSTAYSRPAPQPSALVTSAKLSWRAGTSGHWITNRDGTSFPHRPWYTDRTSHPRACSAPRWGSMRFRCTAKASRCVGRVAPTKSS